MRPCACGRDARREIEEVVCLLESPKTNKTTVRYRLKRLRVVALLWALRDAFFAQASGKAMHAREPHPLERYDAFDARMEPGQHLTWAAQSKNQRAMKVNASSVKGGIFGHMGGGREREEDFLSKLEMAEQRDQLNLAPRSAPHKTNVLFGDDSRPDERQWRTTNETQHGAAQLGQEQRAYDLQLQQERQMFEALVHQHGLSPQEAQMEIAMHRQEQQRQHSALSQLAPLEQQPAAGQRPKGLSPTPNAPSPPKRTPGLEGKSFGSSPFNSRDHQEHADQLKQQFQEQWDQKYARRDKGGPHSLGEVAGYGGARPAGAPRSLLEGTGAPSRTEIPRRHAFRQDAHNQHINIFGADRASYQDPQNMTRSLHAVPQNDMMRSSVQNLIYG